MAVALRRAGVAVAWLYAGLMAGCGGRPAMTTDEFRVKQAGTLDIIEVDRPLRDVAATFRDRAPACIQDVQTTSFNGPPGQRLMSQWRYHETVKVSDRQVELSIQAMTPQARHFELPDENGIYVMLARAFAVDGRRTRVEFYDAWGPMFEEDRVKTAIRGWAAGTFAGCPAMP